MARKSNKTAHVLGLITNEKKEAPAETESTETTLETTDTGEPSETAKPPANFSKPKASIPILEIASGGSAHISDAIRQNLIQEVFPDDPEFALPMEDIPSHNEAEYDEADTAPSAPLTEQEPWETPSSADELTNPFTESEPKVPSVQEEIQTALENFFETSEAEPIIEETLDNCNHSEMLDVSTVKPNKKVSVVSDFQPSDFSTQTTPLEKIITHPDFKYSYINIAEKAVTEKVLEYMNRFNMCTCDRCVVDTIALSLTHLPAKYIVTSREDSLALMNYYTLKYNISIISELTKACMVVSQNPHHNK